MDYILDIIIYKNEMHRIDLSESLFQWGEHAYACEPPQYNSTENIQFELVDNIDYYEKIVSLELNEKVIILTLKSDMLPRLIYEINTGWDVCANILLRFLMSLCELSMFYILLARDDENIKERIEVREQEQILSIVCESLNWGNPKDILLYKL